MRFRARLLTAIAAAALIPLGLSGGSAIAVQPATAGLNAEPSGLTAAQVRQLSAGATDRSIIIFKNQFSDLPMRGATEQLRVSSIKAAQAPVLAELTRLHAKNVQGFQIINAIAATISPAEVHRLAANPAVESVDPDTVQHLQAADPAASAAAAANHTVTTGAVTADHVGPAQGATQQLCPANPAQPLIEPESRTLMNADAANQIVTGAGIKVGLIYDGIDPDNPDLIRPDGQHVIYDYQDFSGDGPTSATSGQALYFAGLIAAQGNQTYDLSKYVNAAHPLPAGCNIKIEGLAPGASVAEMDAFGDDAAVYNSSIIQAIQYAVTVEHVNVLDEPYGGDPVPNTQNDPSALADQAAVAAGVVVVSNTGDNGNTDTDINSPGGVPGVIGVGASTAFQTYRQTDANGPSLGTSGWEDNNISADSTTGINEYGPRTMDVVAPGDTVWGLCSTDTTRFFACTDGDNGSAPGITQDTSSGVSATEVAAVAALVDQAYGKTHNGALPSPALVEQIIVSSATDLGAPADHQGAGLVNALKAVQLAESINSANRTGSTLLVNQTSLNATVNANQSHTFSVGVTNEGSAPQRVTPALSGNPSTVSSDTGSVALSSSDPTSVDGAGNTDYYAVHKFTVPGGAGYLYGDITWDAQKVAGAAYEELFDPQGKLAAYSVLSGEQSGYGNVEVSQPAAGNWTAVIYTTSAAKYFGSVQYSYTAERFNRAGSVWPASRTLAPGQSATFQVSVTAGQPGDEAFILHMGTGSSTDGAIPVIVRALVPVNGGGGSFTGTLTGDGSPGGSTAAGGQELTYQFNVPPGQPSLNVAIALRDADYELEGTLVAPDGQPLDLQSTANDANAPGSTMQFFERTPAAGLWTVSLLTFAADDGQHLSEPFTGRISLSPPPVTSKGLPDSASTTLTAGQPVTATITVTNTGNITKDYFADPRLDGQTQQTLLGTTTVGGSSYTDKQLTVSEPLSGSVNPHWLVPTDTSKLVITADSTLPITFDINSDNNDPEELGVSSGDDSVATATAAELAPGQEWAAPEPTGPFSAAVSGTTNLVAVATANPFDTAITASTGDAWQLSVNSSASYKPLTLAPGQSGSITLTITPTAAKGTVVSGFIAVDTYNSATSSGDELINIPYTYTAG